jgi:cation:H+ antiporter
MESTGAWAPWCFVALFLMASLLMIWRLEAMNAGGLEGTVLGTLVMPYCSGMSNLLLAVIIGSGGGPPEQLLTNALVNNVTNLTLLLGLPAIFGALNLLPASKARKKGKQQKSSMQTRQLSRLSLLLTLTAGLFFTGALWTVARKGRLELADGLLLIGLFLFWQCFHVFEVLKTNVRQNRSLSWMLPLDLLLLGIGACGIYVSTNWLVPWVSRAHLGFINMEHLGWLSGWLMVLPNALLAFYYAWRGKPEIVYASQVGDGHVSIPLSIGICALYGTIRVPAFLQTGLLILLGVAALHFFCVAFFGRLPKAMGWVLMGVYLVFLYCGLGK